MLPHLEILLFSNSSLIVFMIHVFSKWFIGRCISRYSRIPLSSFFILAPFENMIVLLFLFIWSLYWNTPNKEAMVSFNCPKSLFWFTFHLSSKWLLRSSLFLLPIMMNFINPIARRIPSRVGNDFVLALQNNTTSSTNAKCLSSTNAKCLSYANAVEMDSWYWV